VRNGPYIVADPTRILPLQHNSCPLASCYQSEGVGPLVSSDSDPSALNRLYVGFGIALFSTVVIGLQVAGGAYAARGHEWGFTLGWGVATGAEKLEVCRSDAKCNPHRGIVGSGKGQFDVPVAVAVNEATGNFYVLDETNGRVQWFSPDGEYLGTFDGSGIFEVENKEETGPKPPTGKLLRPRTITVDNSCVVRHLVEPQCKAEDPSSGAVYVTASDPEDPFHQVIDKFTATGEFVNQVQVPLVAPREEGLLEIMGVAVDAQGALWVAEDQGLPHRGFEKFTDSVENEAAEFIPARGVRFIGFGVLHPALAVAPDGDFYVNDSFEAPFNEVVADFSSAGEERGVVVQQQSRGVAVERARGDVFVDNVTSLGRFTPEVPAAQVERFGEGFVVDGRGMGIASGVVAGQPDREEPLYVADAGAADVVVFPMEGSKPPTIEGVSVSGVTADSATLRATVNPRGASTDYIFEYGICGSPSTCSSSAFEATAPSGGASVGGVSDFEGHEVDAHPQDLKAGTTYHFRVRARNEKNAAEEFVESTELVFKTQAGVPASPLMDGRAWEMVSPSHKHGTRIRGILSQGVIQANLRRPVQRTTGN